MSTPQQDLEEILDRLDELTKAVESLEERVLALEDN